MVNFDKSAVDIWRDFKNGAPSMGKHEPDKAEIRQWGRTIEGSLENLRAIYPEGSVITIAGAMSQSNLYANDTATTGSNKGTNPNVYAWSNAGGAFGVATLGSDPFRPDAGSGIPNNCVFQFAKWLQEQTGATVYLFLYAVPNTPATWWMTLANGGPNNSNNRYDASTPDLGGTVLKTQTLCNAFFASPQMVSAGKTRFDFTILFRGENDDDFGVDECERQFLILIDQWRSETWADDDTVFVACEMLREQNKYPNAIEAWQRIVRYQRRPNVALATTYGIPSVGDGTHVTGAGLETVGRERIPDALRAMIVPPRIAPGYEGRNNPIDVTVATTPGAPLVITLTAPNTIIDVLYNSGDTYISIDPAGIGRGGSFTVRHWAQNYTTHVLPGAGSTFDIDTWETGKPETLVSAFESVTFFKGGSSATGPYQVLSAVTRDLFSRDIRNAIANGDFEAGSRNWTMTNGWSAEFTTTEAYSGKWMARHLGINSSASDILQRNPVRVNPGDTVVVSGRVKQSGVSINQLRLQIVWLDKAMAELSFATSPNYSGIGASYEPLYNMAVAPANAFYAVVRLRHQRTNDGVFAGTLYADELRLNVLGQHDALVPQHLVQSADYTLTSSTSQQKIFNEDSTGDATVEPGLYHLRMVLRLTGLSSSSGAIGIGLLGTATMVPELLVTARKGTSPGAAEIAEVTSNGGTSVVTASTATVAQVIVDGTVEVTASGTLIPAINLGVAAAAVVKKRSRCVLTRIPSDQTGKVAMGLWA